MASYSVEICFDRMAMLLPGRKTFPEVCCAMRAFFTAGFPCSTASDRAASVTCSKPSPNTFAILTHVDDDSSRGRILGGRQ
jgi:hypothetical protein